MWSRWFTTTAVWLECEIPSECVVLSATLKKNPFNVSDERPLAGESRLRQYLGVTPSINGKVSYTEHINNITSKAFDFSAEQEAYWSVSATHHNLSLLATCEAKRWVLL